ncbi:MAG: N-formylglutamate amidohydrolase [Kiloniellales bacterium]|nr:N-formylglutamate amidohydrolase [Kiloniellales bacterium]
MTDTSKQDEDDAPFALTRGAGPIVAAAIHAGTRVRDEVAGMFAISEPNRLREEDPFTDYWTDIVPNQIVGRRSRFEIDLNRERPSAIYLDPNDSWGLQVWKASPATDVLNRSYAIHDTFYANVKAHLDDLQRRYGRFIVLDLHSYNHRRDGPHTDPAAPHLNPEVNIGTFSMDRAYWAPIVDSFMSSLAEFDYGGRRLDVRENVRFQGRGEFARFIHSNFPESGCCLAIELKKFFMDEWTGEPYETELNSIREALASTIPVLNRKLNEL